MLPAVQSLRLLVRRGRLLVGWMVLAFGFPAVTKVTWIALYFIRVASLLLAPDFPCASGGRSSGPGIGRGPPANPPHEIPAQVAVDCPGIPAS